MVILVRLPCNYHSTKPTKAKRNRKVFNFCVTGFFALFCFGRWGDIFKCLFPRTVVNPNYQISWDKHKVLTAKTVSYMSLSVYFRWLFGCNMALEVIFPPKILRAMQHWHLSPRYHSKKPYYAQGIRKILISVAGFFAFFCFDSWGDILMLVPTNCCDLE